MPEEKFVRINIKAPAKREIDILAASEQRSVYEIVDDMLKLYKAVTIKGHPKSKNAKNIRVVEIQEVVASHE